MNGATRDLNAATLLAGKASVLTTWKYFFNPCGAYGRPPQKTTDHRMKIPHLQQLHTVT